MPAAQESGSQVHEYDQTSLSQHDCQDGVRHSRSYSSSMQLEQIAAKNGHPHRLRSMTVGDTRSVPDHSTASQVNSFHPNYSKQNHAKNQEPPRVSGTQGKGSDTQVVIGENQMVTAEWNLSN